METNHWLLPEGIDEVLPPRAERLEALRRDVVDLFHAWGYELVKPPLIEFLESLLTGAAHELDTQTFKLTDQLTGRTMGVRADMTPQVARIDAHQLKRDVPVRLCYIGSVLNTRPDGFAGSRSPLQLGAELYGHAGIESDVEVLSLMMAVLAVAGVTDVHVDLGHVGIFGALARQAGLTSAQESTLFDILQRKARNETEEFLAQAVSDVDCAHMLGALADLNGNEQVLQDAAEVLGKGDAAVHTALANLRAVSALARRRIPGLTLHYDLAELRGYHYHTGVLFAAYVPGCGQEIARGGRYDAIGEVFGRARPATGFSTDMKTLMAIGTREMPVVDVVLAPASEEPALAQRVAELRAAGTRVIAALPGQQGDAAAMGCTHELRAASGQWVLKQV